MQERKSVLCEKYVANRDKWVVGMLRKPDGDNPHHVLLVVQGGNSFGQVLLRRYDLYIDNNRAKDPKTKQPFSSIVMRPDKFCAVQDAKAHLDQLVNAEKYYVKAWEISADKGRELHDNITETQKNPPLYLESGDASCFSCDGNSKKIDGHSCYTWARYES